MFIFNFFKCKCGYNGYKGKKLSKKRECHNENMFFEALRALRKLNFFFHLKSKTNLVTWRKCNSHLQYYKLDLSFSVKLQEINLNVCDECYQSYVTLNSSIGKVRRNFFLNI